MADTNHFADPKALAAELREKLNLSNGYASDLANAKRLPSLTLASEIEVKLGIPASAWTRRETGVHGAAA